MAALQKFRLLATQCATAGSPSRSPATAASAASPAIRLRRRGTLRKFLGRSPRRGEAGAVKKTEVAGGNEEEEVLLERHTLRDLFVSSPPQLDGGASAGPALRGPDCGGARRSRLEALGAGFWARRRGAAARRFGSSAALRHRLLRRAWRPELVTIPE